MSKAQFTLRYFNTPRTDPTGKWIVRVILKDNQKHTAISDCEKQQLDPFSLFAQEDYPQIHRRRFYEILKCGRAE